MSSLLTEKEAAAMLHMSERLLREKRRHGEIRYVALSARKIAYRQEDCAEYIEARARIDVPVTTSHTMSSGRTKGRRPVVVPFSQRKARK